MSAGFTTLAAATCVVVAGTLALKGRVDRAEEFQENGLPPHEHQREGQSFVADLDEQKIPRREDRSLVGKLYRDGFVVVGGQVKSPGRIAFSKGMSLGEAIESVWGATPFASLKRVRLTRAGRVFEFNLDETNSRGVAVLPGDVIEVPEKMIFGR